MTTMVLALIIFAVTYVLMLVFQKYRPYIALTSAVIFICLGIFGVIDGFGIFQALKEVDYNVLMMIGGTMGTVTLFIESKMPARLSELVIAKVPNVLMAVTALSLFAGVISAFVDNVATVLMVAPIGLAISKKLKISPVPVIISIAVSSNLQGAATLVGDTTSILLGGEANMNFLDFFWMNGKAGIFFATELGALASVVALIFIFRKDKGKVSATVETTVEDFVPTYLLLLTVVLLIFASFIPRPENAFSAGIYELRNGIICVLICFIGIVYECRKQKTKDPLKQVLNDFDKDTVLLLFGLFIVIAGIKQAGVIDAIADAFSGIAGSSRFTLYLLIVVASVVLSAFIDNIPYVATMLPVVTSIAAKMSCDPNVFYFGLLIGATLGGNLTPIGASANIAGIGILRKNGETVKNSDFLRIGIPFTLAAVIVGSAFTWLVWG